MVTAWLKALASIVGFGFGFSLVLVWLNSGGWWWGLLGWFIVFGTIRVFLTVTGLGDRLSVYFRGDQSAAAERTAAEQVRDHEAMNEVGEPPTHDSR
jgi:hypothetical protein